MCIRDRLLTQLRYFGFHFNPVNFYYCYDEADTLRWVLAEVRNTPWNERHYYAAVSYTHLDVYKRQVLGLPPAFNLSHDQTLQFKFDAQRIKLRNELRVHS